MTTHSDDEDDLSENDIALIERELSDERASGPSPGEYLKAFLADLAHDHDEASVRHRIAEHRDAIGNPTSDPAWYAVLGECIRVATERAARLHAQAMRELRAGQPLSFIPVEVAPFAQRRAVPSSPPYRQEPRDTYAVGDDPDHDPNPPVRIVAPPMLPRPAAPAASPIRRAEPSTARRPVAVPDRDPTGADLLAWRKRRGYTQQKVAEMFCSQQPTIARAEGKGDTPLVGNVLLGLKMELGGEASKRSR